jgi:hypothetical protein
LETTPRLGCSLVEEHVPSTCETWFHPPYQTTMTAPNNAPIPSPPA